MNKPNVFTAPGSPVTVPNPVGGALIGELGGIPQPDTAAVQVLNSTLIPMLLATLIQQKYSPKTKSSVQDVYDIIIVGAGAAGCVVANRMSEMKCLRTLLLEAGNIPSVSTEIPGTAIALKSTDMNWNFWTEPQKNTGGGQFENRIPYDCGKGVGGSSLINAMLYSRGNVHDYDDWEALGATGWSHKNVRPYFLKLENNTDPDLVANGSCHNVSGPMTFSKPRYISYLKNPVIEGAKSLGYTVVDSNCEKQLGVADLQTFIRHGQRCSAAKGYLVPVDDRPNLDIVTEAFVTKIQITNKTARGVCFEYKGSQRCVKANRQVIISAGSVNSVKLLMLSGIGPRETLEKLGIPVHADLPVGHNLQDHITAIIFFHVPHAVPYIAKLTDPVYIQEYLTNRSGPLASATGVFYIGFQRSDDAATPEDVPNFESYFAEGSNLAARFLFGLKPLTYKKLFLPYETSATMWCLSSVVNPKSRGNVTINSTDPHANPIIDPNFLSDPQDIKDIVAGLKFCSDVASTPQVKEAGVKPFETKMPGCEHLADGTDEYFKCYVSQFTFSIWHPTGTTKMGNKHDPTTVVDPKLRVKGIRRLRVINASVMPKVASGNTMVPTMMVAEKGSDLIKETINCR